MLVCNDLTFSGEIVTPQDKGYNEERQIYNRAFQKYPKIIFYCECEEDVSVAIQYCRRCGLPIRIRSGGHNYNGFCIEDGVGLIDVSRLSNIMIDEEAGCVTIQAGVSNTQLYEELAKRRYPFPGGTCPSVGVCGYTLGGGWGLSARLFGLGCDNLLEAQMIDYTGQRVVASEVCNPELFWALRGSGGGNFGVVVSLTFRLPPKLFYVTGIRLDYPHQTAEEQAQLMMIWQNNIVSVDRRLNMIGRLFHTQKDGVGAYILGLFYGSKEEVMPLIAPFLDCGMTVKADIYETTFIDVIRNVAEVYGIAIKSKVGSRFVTQKYSYDTLLDLTRNLQHVAPGSTAAYISLLGLGGATQDPGSQETAFYYRNANYIISVQSVWQEAQYAADNKVWVDHVFDQVKTLTPGSFVNIQFDPLTNYEWAYYGENTCRLRHVGAMYDPFDVFTYAQGIQ